MAISSLEVKIWAVIRQTSLGGLFVKWWTSVWLLVGGILGSYFPLLTLCGFHDVDVNDFHGGCKIMGK